MRGNGDGRTRHTTSTWPPPSTRSRASPSRPSRWCTATASAAAAASRSRATCASPTNDRRFGDHTRKARPGLQPGVHQAARRRGRPLSREMDPVLRPARIRRGRASRSASSTSSSQPTNSRSRPTNSRELITTQGAVQRPVGQADRRPGPGRADRRRRRDHAKSATPRSTPRTTPKVSARSSRSVSRGSPGHDHHRSAHDRRPRRRRRAAPPTSPSRSSAAISSSTSSVSRSPIPTTSNPARSHCLSRRICATPRALGTEGVRSMNSTDSDG